MMRPSFIHSSEVSSEVSSASEGRSSNDFGECECEEETAETMESEGGEEEEETYIPPSPPI